MTEAQLINTTVGATFDITLPGKSIMGCTWILTADSDAVAFHDEHRAPFSPTHPIVCGAEADDIFTFTATAAGSATITAQLVRTFGDPGPYETRTFNVTVAPAH